MSDDFTPWPARSGRDDRQTNHRPPRGDRAAVGREQDMSIWGADPDADPAVAGQGATTAVPVSAEAAVDPHPAVFIDSSAIVALVDRDDTSHADAVAAYQGLVEGGYRLFTTNYVIAETFDLLSVGVGHVIARQWLRDCEIAVYHADEQDERRAKRLILQARGADGLSLTDAMSLVIMERLDVADAFAVDPSFLAGAE